MLSSHVNNSRWELGLVGLWRLFGPTAVGDLPMAGSKMLVKDTAEQCKTKQSQSTAEMTKAKQSQSQAKPSRAEQSRADRSQAKPILQTR